MTKEEARQVLIRTKGQVTTEDWGTYQNFFISDPINDADKFGYGFIRRAKILKKGKWQWDDCFFAVCASKETGEDLNLPTPIGWIKDLAKYWPGYEFDWEAGTAAKKEAAQ